MTAATDVAIIGAGPYGLSLAAHLHSRGVRYRIFGDPMRFWRDMPIGVNLKSLAFATNIYVPQGGHAFPAWCVKNGLEDYEPCTMQSFAAYGAEMQKRFVPNLEELFVTNVKARNAHFEVTLASGEVLCASNVVSCTGLSGLSHIPAVLQGLGPNLMKHTFDISDYAQFKNRTVAVIGAGASAIEAGALVREAGGSSEVFVRGEQPVFHGREPRIRPLWQRVKNPTTVLGTSRSGWVLQHLPTLVYRMPRERRTRFVKSHLGPASPWWIRDRVHGKVPIHTHRELIGASARGAGVRLEFRNGSGELSVVDADFVIAGTGYEADIARLNYLDSELKSRIRCIERAPELSIHFESSVRGLYFLGHLSFMCFGPMFRFVSGAEVSSRRLLHRLGH